MSNDTNENAAWSKQDTSDSSSGLSLAKPSKNQNTSLKDTEATPGSKESQKEKDSHGLTKRQQTLSVLIPIKKVLLAEWRRGCVSNDDELWLSNKFKKEKQALGGEMVVKDGFVVCSEHEVAVTKAMNSSKGLFTWGELMKWAATGALIGMAVDYSRHTTVTTAFSSLSII